MGSGRPAQRETNQTNSDLEKSVRKRGRQATRHMQYKFNIYHKGA